MYMELTKEKLQAITGIKDDVKLESLLDGLKEAMVKYSINTPARMRHFLAQLMHESEDFTAMKENLNYSAKAIHATWPSHFTVEQATECEHQPEKIGNRAYANRMGNGDVASGDGYKFRGRGAIQLTGKDNYKAVGKSLGLDLLTHPELLEQPKYAILSGGWFWNSHNLNAVADTCGDDVTKITKIINGGVLGLESRQANYNKAKHII